MSRHAVLHSRMCSVMGRVMQYYCHCERFGVYAVLM